MSPQANKRAIVRFPCAIPLGAKARSAPLGQIVDISLDGLRVATRTPLPEHSVVPVVFRLGARGPEISPEAQIVHHEGGQMGLRFVAVSSQDRRRLRRYVSELANVVGNRASAEALMDAADELARVPFSEPHKIKLILAQAARAAAFTLIPAARTCRATARIDRIGDDALTFVAGGDHDLVVGETVFVLYTLEFVSYSFKSQVQAVVGANLTLAFPRTLSYSERRAGARQQVAGATVTLAVPGRAGAEMVWPLVDQDAGGLAFRVDGDAALFWPGMDLPELRIDGPEGEQRIQGAQVRHLTVHRAAAGDHAAGVRVGVAFRPPSSCAPEATSEDLDHLPAGGALGRLGRDLITRAAYLYHRYHRRLRPQHSAARAARVVSFENSRGQPVVGLLGLTVPPGHAAPPTLPTVIVTPGFGARKETMGAFASILSEHFRRQHRGVAVLRYDGTNAVGESYKSPGCTEDGKETLKYTVSGCIADITGAMAWVRHNPHFTPAEVVVVSVSFSGVAVRRALTLPEMAQVRHWVSFMGAPDAQNAIMNVAGNVDGYALYLKGISMGTISLLGCLTDCDHFLGDLLRLGVATVQDACRDMAKIGADVTWFVGRQDAYMDPQRVREVMSVPAPGRRQVVEIEAGHVPQSSDEALAGFALMTRHIFRALTQQDAPVLIPSRGKIAVTMEREWQRVRRRPVTWGREFWQQALELDDGALGYDAYTLLPEYLELVADTAGLAAAGGRDVLELGAGTGNLARALALCGNPPRAMICLDLVPAALARLAHKLAGRVPLTQVEASADGGPRVALRRWLAGDLSSFSALVARLPEALRPALVPIAANYGDDVHAYLRGGASQASELAARRALGPEASAALAALRSLVGAVSGAVAVDPATLPEPHRAILEASCGLPFADQSVDVVVAGLLLGALRHPDDALFEMRRVLRPGGRLVVSSMLPDAELSRVFRAALARVQTLRAADLPAGQDRESALAALRALEARHARLMRLQEEGVLRAYSGHDLQAMVAAGGFVDVSLKLSFGRPSQAAICSAHRPA